MKTSERSSFSQCNKITSRVAGEQVKLTLVGVFKITKMRSYTTNKVKLTCSDYLTVMRRSTKFISFFSLFFLINSVIIFSVSSQDLERYSFDSRNMGTKFNIILYAEDEKTAARAAEAAFDRVEDLNQIMSDYVENSELNRLSRKSGSGEWMKISNDLFQVLKISIDISDDTNGLFDVTAGTLTHEWRFIRMMPEPVLPDEEELAQLLERVGYQHLELDEKSRSARLSRENMQLDLGGIAKGFAAEEAIKTLKDLGIQSALVDAGGDITISEPPPGRSSWTVAVPKGTPNGDPEMITLKLSNKTVTTSGDMFQFLEIGGERYSHIINPKTGLGSTSRIQATVISKNGMFADAYASVLTLMEPEKGIELINSIESTEAVIFRNDNGEIRDWTSDGYDNYLKND